MASSEWRRHGHSGCFPHPPPRCAELDRAVLFVLFGGNDRAKQSKVRSRRLKFVQFANELGLLPLLPTKPATLMR